MLYKIDKYFSNSHVQSEQIYQLNTSNCRIRINIIEMICINIFTSRLLNTHRILIINQCGRLRTMKHLTFRLTVKTTLYLLIKATLQNSLKLL